MRFDRAVHDREAKSAAVLFRGDERLEQAIANLAGNSCSRVAHFEHYRAAPEARLVRRQLVTGELSRFDPHLSAGRRSLSRIEDKIEDCAMEQIIIANDDQR